MGKINMKLANGIEAEEKALQQTTQKAPEPKKKEKTDISPTETEKAVKTENRKPQKQTFSFRADVESIIRWKAYAKAQTMDNSTLWTAAIDEYMNRHKLTDKQKTIYDAALQIEKGKM